MKAIMPHVTDGAWLRTNSDVQWLDLEAVADVTITARGERLARAGSMWSANCPGEQMIEIRFHHPTAVRRLRVRSTETEVSRTQQMTVWACLHRGERHREVVRQQFNFSPDGATEESKSTAWSSMRCQQSNSASFRASTAVTQPHT